MNIIEKESITIKYHKIKDYIEVVNCEDFYPDNDMVIVFGSSDLEDSKYNTSRNILYTKTCLKKDVLDIQNEIDKKNCTVPMVYKLSDGLVFIASKTHHYNKTDYDLIQKGFKILREYINNSIMEFDIQPNKIYVLMEYITIDDKLDKKHIIKKIKKTFKQDDDYDIVIVNSCEVI